MLNLKSTAAAVFALLAGIGFSAPAFADINVSGVANDADDIELCTGSAGVQPLTFTVDVAGTGGFPLPLANGDVLQIDVPFEWDITNVAQECFDAAVALNGGFFDINIVDDSAAFDGINGLSLLAAPVTGDYQIDALTGTGVLTYVYDVSGLSNEVLYLNQPFSVTIDAGFNVPTAPLNILAPTP